MSNKAKNIRKIENLAEVLAKSRKVKSHDQPEEPQAWTLAWTFSEIEESMLIFLEELLPTLKRATTEQEVDQVLSEIEDELYHVVYHSIDPEFFRNIRRRMAALEPVEKDL